MDDGIRVLDASGADVPPEPATRLGRCVRRVLKRAPKLGDCTGCGTVLYQASAAERGLCWECALKQEERRQFDGTTAQPITRAEALAQLRDLATSKHPDDAHGYADHILLRLLNDPDIAAAWYAVPKWYA